MDHLLFLVSQTVCPCLKYYAVKATFPGTHLKLTMEYGSMLASCTFLQKQCAPWSVRLFIHGGILMIENHLRQRRNSFLLYSSYIQSLKFRFIFFSGVFSADSVGHFSTFFLFSTKRPIKQGKLFAFEYLMTSVLQTELFCFILDILIQSIYVRTVHQYVVLNIAILPYYTTGKRVGIKFLLKKLLLEKAIGCCALFKYTGGNTD